MEKLILAMTVKPNWHHLALHSILRNPSDTHHHLLDHPTIVYFDIDDFPTAPLHTCHQLVVHITADPYQFIAAVHLLCFVYSLILLHNYRFNTTLDHCQYQYSKIQVTLNFDHLHLVDHLCNHQFVASVSIGTFDFEFFCLCHI